MVQTLVLFLGAAGSSQSVYLCEAEAYSNHLFTMKLYHFLFLLCTPFLFSCEADCFATLPRNVIMEGFGDSAAMSTVVYAVDKRNGKIIDSNKQKYPERGGSSFSIYLPQAADRLEYDYKVKISSTESYTLSRFIYRKQNCRSNIFEPDASYYTLLGYYLDATYIVHEPNQMNFLIIKP